MSEITAPPGSDNQGCDIPPDTEFLHAFESSLMKNVTASEISSETHAQAREQPYKRKTYCKSEYNGLVAPNPLYWQRYLHYIWEENKLQRHVERIINARPRVDCRAPLINPKYFFNPKKFKDVDACYRLQNERNEDLMRRISLAVSSDRRNRVDCWNSNKPARFNNAPFARERLRQVKKDNVLLLERVMAVPPTPESHRARLYDEYKRKRQLAKTLRKFPEVPSVTATVNVKDNNTNHVKKRFHGLLPPIHE